MEKEKYRCSECKMYKSADEFFHVAHNKYRKETSYMCKECKKRVRKEKVKELSDAESLLDTMKIRLNDARNRAKKKNLYFDLTLDNLQLVCHAANMMKGTFSEDELLKFCNAIIKNKNYA